MTDDEKELEAIAESARQLPTLTPSRDLWPEIAARIGATPQRAVSDRPLRMVGAGFSNAQFALAASLLIMLSSAVTWTLASRGDDAVTAAATFAGAVDDETAADLHLAALDASVSSMDEEIALLETIVRENRVELDARTVAVLESNLKVIDAAIAESRAALAADPASQFLAAQFARAYTSKLTLLRDAATLPTGI